LEEKNPLLAGVFLMNDGMREDVKAGNRIPTREERIEQLTKKYRELVGDKIKARQIAEEIIEDQEKLGAEERSRIKEVLERDVLLKNLYNRGHFDETIINDIKRVERSKDPKLSLLIADIDHFKQVNDTLGHQGGDEILRKVAEIIKNTVRDTDFPARYGGEEFAIIYRETNGEATKGAERLRKAIEDNLKQFILDTYGEEGANLAGTISIGVATYEEEDNVESLIERADQALYEAKKRGRNKVVNANEITGDELKDGETSPIEEEVFLDPETESVINEIESLLPEDPNKRREILEHILRKN